MHGDSALRYAIKGVGGVFEGTSFPSPPTGLAYRTDHRTLYFWNAASSVWLSVQVHEIMYGQTGSTPPVTSATTGFFRTGPSSAQPLYSQNFGFVFGFPVAIVGITWKSVSNTTAGIVGVYANNSAVAGATMTLGVTTKKTREDFLPAAFVAAEQLIAVRNADAVAVGAVTGGGMIRFRRRET